MIQLSSFRLKFIKNIEDYELANNVYITNLTLFSRCSAESPPLFCYTPILFYLYV